MSDLEKLEAQHREEGVDATPTPSVLDGSEHHRLTKSILRKLDTRMLPMLAILFLFSFLDRTNIGNAKVRLP